MISFLAYLSSPRIIDSNSNRVNNLLEKIFDEYIEIYKYSPPIIRLSLLLTRMNIPTVSAMYSIDVLKKCLDSRATIIEDWPLWINIFSRDIKVYFDLKKNVCYRVHPKQSTGFTNDNFIINSRNRDGNLVHEMRTSKTLPVFVRLIINMDYFGAFILSKLPFLEFDISSRIGFVIHPIVRFIFYVRKRIQYIKFKVNLFNFN